MKKKWESSGGARGLHGARNVNPSASAFGRSILLPGGAQKCWVVRWVWKLVLVIKVPISMDPYSLDTSVKGGN